MLGLFRTTVYSSHQFECETLQRDQWPDVLRSWGRLIINLSVASHGSALHALYSIFGFIQVCNNRGTCSCNTGYIGSNCETASNGPSMLKLL